MQLATCIPILGLCSDSVEAYKGLISCIMSNSYLIDTYIENLPFTMQVLSQKLKDSVQGHKTKGGKIQ